MLRFFVVTLIFLLAACTADPALDLEKLEADARGGDASSIEQLVGLLSSAEPGLSDRVYALVVDVGHRTAPALLAQVQSEDKQMREYVIAALGTLKIKQAVVPISAVLSDPKLERRYVAAWALGEIGGENSALPLINALNDENSEVRRYATRALIKLNKIAVLPLVEYLSSAKGEGAAAAIRALGDIADKRALDALLSLTQGEQRAEAYLALGKLRDSRAESALIAGLQDGDSQTRMNAAMALGPLGGVDSAAALQKTLEDEVHVVREWSARSLEMITGKPVLYRNSHDEYVRPYNVYH